LEGPSMAYTGREGLEPSKFLRGRGLRPRPRSSEDQQRIQAMRREIERDFDAIGEKIEKFVEYASWGGQGQLVEIETQIPEKLASSRSGIKGTGHAIKEKQRKPGPGNTLTVWCTYIGQASSDAIVTVEVIARVDHVEFDEDGHTHHSQGPTSSRRN
jgi:hypothetical protein